MRIVIDANILVSFFRFNPVRSIIINSEFLGIKLFTPEYAIDELKKNEADILKYSKINPEQFNEVLYEMARFIDVVPNDLFKEFEKEAKKLIHEKDVPIFALALKLNCPIWSDEEAFKRQSLIKIFDTKELVTLLNL